MTVSLYIYYSPPQLFDTENEVNRHNSRYLFTTEGHIFRINPALRVKPWESEGAGRKEGVRGGEDVSRAVARSNESFIAHSVSHEKAMSGKNAYTLYQYDTQSQVVGFCTFLYNSHIWMHTITVIIEHSYYTPVYLVSCYL